MNKYEERKNREYKEGLAEDSQLVGYLSIRIELNIRQISKEIGLSMRNVICIGIQEIFYICPKCTEICKGDKISRKE
jgi:hypothetical protein